MEKHLFYKTVPILTKLICFDRTPSVYVARELLKMYIQYRNAFAQTYPRSSV